jgi:hypothetical protein
LPTGRICGSRPGGVALEELSKSIHDSSRSRKLVNKKVIYSKEDEAKSKGLPEILYGYVYH